jgi:three-Cys-motif partner protein
MKKHTQFGVQQDFFKAPTDASRRKMEIAIKYFDAFMNVFAREGEAGYSDLFAGPGRYDNGDKSVPLAICERVVADERLSRFVRLWFNEGDPELAARLKENVHAVDGIARLHFEPKVTTRVVGKDLAPSLEARKIPAFTFADPCGYKGLSMKLITAAIKPFGNDCLFFFNYNRVNMKLEYPVMDDSINEFFEADRAAKLRSEMAILSSPRDREKAVLEAIKGALRAADAFPLVFAFRTREGGGTSHHLVFASKGQKGASIMKRIMTQASSEIIDGVGSWDYDPRDHSATLSLFSGLDAIRDRLLRTFSGQTVTFGEIIGAEMAITQYTDSNYRDALLELETEERVRMQPAAESRPFQAGGTKRSLAKDTQITFIE